MNLRSIVRGAINSVNPDHLIIWQPYQGYTTSGSGRSTPIYGTQSIWSQIQPVPTGRLAHLEQLNIQGVLRSVFMRGAVASAVREDGTGGDLLQFPEIPGGPARNWLVELVDEQWSDADGAAWCRVTVTLQNDINSATS